MFLSTKGDSLFHQHFAMGLSDPPVGKLLVNDVIINELILFNQTVLLTWTILCRL